MNIQFSQSILSMLQAEHLWRLIVEAFEHSEQSPLWPNELESLHCDNLTEGATVQAVYHVGLVDLPQTYHIPTFKPGQHLLTYRTGPNHPLQGGGTVEVRETNRGSQLRWSGQYTVRNRPDALGAALFVKGWFERKFFGQLEENLRRLERLAPDEEVRLTA